MVIIQVAGGLGNQLQQYALYRKFVSLGVAARLDTCWFDTASGKQGSKVNKVTKRELELTYFDRLQFETCTEEERKELIGSPSFAGKLRRKLLPGTIHRFTESQMYHPEILTFENMYICGYFACEKYYGDILYDIRERLQFPPGSNPAHQELLQEIKECEAVSVHLRRGDYLNEENRELFGNICTDAYYQKAMAYISENCSKPHFFIFSDDVDYARARFQGENATVVDVNHGKDSFYDMQLMSQCKHNICANSTFSFWGARLNPKEGKIMIRPTIHKNSQRFCKEEMQQLWQDWLFVSPQGELY